LRSATLQGNDDYIWVVHHLEQTRLRDVMQSAS
jgi:hypothetical protein